MTTLHHDKSRNPMKVVQVSSSPIAIHGVHDNSAYSSMKPMVFPFGQQYSSMSNLQQGVHQLCIIAGHVWQLKQIQPTCNDNAIPIDEDTKEPSLSVNKFEPVNCLL
jgi:hypothetical protein